MEETRLFSRLIRFENSCSRELLEAMRQLSADEGRAFKLFAHVMESQLIWLARLAGESEVHEKWWPSVGYEGCLELRGRNEEGWNEFLAGLEPERLGQSVSYRSLNGTVAQVVVRDILIQLIIHAAHHWGQIAQAMKDKGLSPPLPNYLTFSRFDPS